MMYRTGMELFARGANLVLPHAMWYDPEKVHIKPLISDFNKDIGPSLPGYNEWVGRCSLLLQGGRHVADIGVLYPVAAMEAYAKLDAFVDSKEKGSVHAGLFMPKETDLNGVSDSLTGSVQRDFTYLHPEILNERCDVAGSTLRLKNKANYEEYKVLVIPGGRVIYWSNLKKIKAFYDAGGKVVATTCLPSKSAEIGHDKDVVEAVNQMFGAEPRTPSPDKSFTKQTNAAGGAGYFVPALNGLAAAIDDALPVPDVRFAEHGPVVDQRKGMLSYLHKVKDGRNVYFVANSTDNPVDTEMTVRGKMTLQRWNPYDGTISAVEGVPIVEGGVPCTRLRLTLAPVDSVFLVESK